MLGLIKKDLLMIKGNIKTLAIIFVVFTIMAINGNGNFAFIPAFMSVMIVMSTFSYDEYNKTDGFITSLPNGKKNAVKSKYISTLIIISVSIILTVIMTMIIGISQNSLDFKEILYTTLGCFAAMLILQSVLYPVIYKYGIEKSRIGVFVGVFGISSIAALLMKSELKIPISPTIITLLNHYWMIILPIVGVIVLLISYKISEHLYLKKEF